MHSFADALWWAIVTVATVGYGDRYPVTAGGRGVAVILMLVGIGLIGVLTATIASYFVEDKAEQDKAVLTDRLDRMEAMLLELLARSSSRPTQHLVAESEPPPPTANGPLPAWRPSATGGGSQQDRLRQHDLASAESTNA